MIAGQGLVAVWGAGGHARVVAEVLRATGSPAIVQVESPIYGDSSAVIREVDPLLAIARLRELGVTEVALAFGNCRGRLAIGELILSNGLSLLTVVHPSAAIAGDARLGC